MIIIQIASNSTPDAPKSCHIRILWIVMSIYVQFTLKNIHTVLSLAIKTHIQQALSVHDSCFQQNSGPNDKLEAIEVQKTHKCCFKAVFEIFYL